MNKRHKDTQRKDGRHADGANHCHSCGNPVRVTWHVPRTCSECGAPFDPQPRSLVSVAFAIAVVCALLVVVPLRMVGAPVPVLVCAGLVVAFVTFNAAEIVMFRTGVLRLANVNASSITSAVALSPEDPDALAKAEDAVRATTHAGTSKRVRAAQRQQLADAIKLARSLRTGEQAQEDQAQGDARGLEPGIEHAGSGGMSEKAVAASRNSGQRVSKPLPRCRFRRVSANNEAGIRRMSVLATNIVRELFDPIVGIEQSDDMVARLATPEAIATRIEDGYEHYFVLPPQEADDTGTSTEPDASRAAGKPIGIMALCAQEDSELYLGAFCLVKEERGKGYARTMTRFAAQRARKLDCDHMTLHIDRNNYQAILACEHLGFELVGEDEAGLMYQLWLA